MKTPDPNPYRPIAQQVIAQSHNALSKQSLPWFLLTHLAAFLTAFVFAILAICCEKMGAMATIHEVFDAPAVLASMAGVGFCAWVPHAMLLGVSPKLRLIAPAAIAVPGAIGFVLCILTYDLIGEYAPMNVAISVSWTPEYILLSIYELASVATVILARWFLLMIGDNHRVHAEARWIGFTNGYSTHGPR